MVEQRPFKALVLGSSPSQPRPSKFSRRQFSVQEYGGFANLAVAQQPSEGAPNSNLFRQSNGNTFWRDENTSSAERNAALDRNRLDNPLPGVVINVSLA